jgi:hypothetical protein
MENRLSIGVRQGKLSGVENRRMIRMFSVHLKPPEQMGSWLKAEDFSLWAREGRQMEAYGPDVRTDIETHHPGRHNVL